MARDDLSSIHPVNVGLSISLSGKYRRLGAQALEGVQLWAGRSGAELFAYDDSSRKDLAIENARRLLERDRIQILLGPYSSGLAAAVAKLADAQGRLMWNYGGASDEVAGRWVVSVPSPASEYFRRLPAWLRQNAPEVRAVTIMYSPLGSFAAHVARGLTEEAEAAGLSTQVLSIGAPPPRGAQALVLAGSFDQEVHVLRSRPPAPIVAAVAAGIRAFYDELGPAAEGVIGPSQWEPGPGSESFVEVFEQRFGHAPEYVAAGAFATGLIVEECLRRAGSLEDTPLREAAASLDFETFYGRFRIDPGSGRQISHKVLLVQWQRGRKIVIG